MRLIIFLIKKHLKVFLNNIYYPEKLTCYPAEKQKSKPRIFLDNLIWLLRFHHANEYYYLWGFDRKNYEQYKQKYINGKLCRKVINRKKRELCPNFESYDIIIHDKFIASQYIESLGFPVPKTIALINNNSILLPKSGKELPLDCLLTEKKRIFRDCICKPVADEKGHGVFHLKIKRGSLFLNNNRFEFRQLPNLFSSSKYIIQERVIQHKNMAALNPHCVNTIRLVTCIHKGDVVPFSAVVRIGRKGNITDNWDTGGIFVGVDIEKGCLKKDGFTMEINVGKRYEIHPETAIKFHGYKIPFCNQAINLAVKLHKYFYCTHSIGWDIAITPKGPVFIECNQGWSPYTHLLVEDNFMDKFREMFSGKQVASQSHHGTVAGNEIP